jgi:hypothetical protein
MPDLLDGGGLILVAEGNQAGKFVNIWVTSCAGRASVLQARYLETSDPALKFTLHERRLK